MLRLRSLKRRIAELLSGDKSVCLWFSGGKDSLLLLKVMLEANKPFGILRFDDGWNREQKKAIDAIQMDNDLQVFSYPAVNHILVGENGDLSMVSQYAVDGYGSTAMLVRDLVDETSVCGIDLKLETATMKVAPAEWDVHVWGSKRTDQHYICGDKPLIDKPDWAVGTKTFTAPLLDWTDAQVQSGLKTYGVTAPSVRTGDIFACSNCLQGQGRVFCPKENTEIDSVVWQPAKNLAMVRTQLA